MFDRMMGQFLVDTGRIGKGQLVEVYKKQTESRAKLGVIAVSERLITIAQAEEINALQAVEDKRFGDIAIERGYLNEAQLARLIDLQGNEFMVFSQTLIDMGYITMDELTEAIKEFQTKNGLLESDIATLKSGDMNRIVDIFVDGSDKYKQLFSMGVRDLYRLVDSNLWIGKTFTTTNIKYEALGYQKIHGDESVFLAIAGGYEDIQMVAKAYTKEPFIETEEDALDAVCELINCINGLYVSERSREHVFMDLEPPVYSTTYSSVSSEEVIVMPVYICNGEVKFLISVGKAAAVKVTN
ncbi:MAG: hypothetical protein K6A23_01690 [Butyrivibrio sp.]|nr:hypothetical protein [Butyrivibrio sp.]